MNARGIILAALVAAAVAPAPAIAEVPAGTACIATSASVSGPSSCRPVTRTFARMAVRRADALDTGRCSRSVVESPHWRCKAYMSNGEIVQGERWGSAWRHVVVR